MQNMRHNVDVQDQIKIIFKIISSFVSFQVIELHSRARTTKLGGYFGRGVATTNDVKT